MKEKTENDEATFAELGLTGPLLDAIRDAGYDKPTPIQREAIPVALKGRDLIGLAQTGTGKTASFTLPIVQRMLGGPRRTRALILTPTRELCLQVEESFRKYSKHAPVDVIPVFGGVGYIHEAHVFVVLHGFGISTVGLEVMVEGLRHVQHVDHKGRDADDALVDGGCGPGGPAALGGSGDEEFIDYY